MSDISQQYYSPSPQRWREVVQNVQRANLNKVQTIKWQSKIRQKAYCSQLDIQVNEHIKCKRINAKQKLKDRQQITLQVQLENQSKILQRNQKMKTQQKYGLDNLKIIHNPQKSQRRNQSSGQHPFIKLVDQQQARNRQTKLKFQFQNHLNTIQSQINRQTRKKLKQQQKAQRKLFEDHVQQQFNKKIIQRQQFRRKYLKVPKYYNSHLRTQSTNSNHLNTHNEYLDYLEEQAFDQKINKKLQKQLLDDRLYQINKKVNEADSSPAYLGRNVYSNDRKKQFEYIDKALHLQKYSLQKPKRQNACKIIDQVQYQRLKQSALKIQQKNQGILPSIQKRRRITQNNSEGHSQLKLKVKFFQKNGITNPYNQIQYLKDSIDNNLKLKTIQNHCQKVQNRSRSASSQIQPNKKQTSILQKGSFFLTRDEVLRAKNNSVTIQKQERRQSICSKAQSKDSSKSYIRYDFISGMNRSYFI